MVNKKIVLVDDDKDVRESIQGALEKAGYQVLSYGSGQEALDALQKLNEKFYALVSDFNMPKMNGIELICKSYAISKQFKLYVIISGVLDKAIDVKSTYEGTSLPDKVYFIEKVNLKKVLFELLDSKIESSDLS